MEYVFFYSSIIIIFFLFFYCLHLRKPSLPSIVIGLTTIGYSFVIDLIFGDSLKLYYYITPAKSTIYMILAALFIYPFLNLLYTMFLPKAMHLRYTVLWIIGLLIFEYSTLLTKTIVFTGWKMFPWSVVLYITSYSLIYSFYIYLLNKFPIATNPNYRRN